jgi:hypothetical protein
MAKKTAKKMEDTEEMQPVPSSGGTEIYSFDAMSDEDLFAGLDVQGSDISGFWDPEVGHGIRGKLLERRTMLSQGQDRGFYVVELETPARIYSEDDPDAMAMAGDRIAIWENYRLMELSQIAGLRPVIALRYRGATETKRGNTVKVIDVGMSREASMRLAELKEQARAQELPAAQSIVADPAALLAKALQSLQQPAS